MTVSNNGVDREPVEGTGAVFAYVPRPEVDGVEPRTLTWHEGATVTVRRRHLAPRARGAVPTCSFRDDDGKGTVVPATDLAAAAEEEEGAVVVSLEVSADDGREFTASGVAFRYFFPRPAASMASNAGPWAGGTRIALRGAGIGRVASVEDVGRLKELHIQNINIFKFRFVFNF